MTSMTAMNTSSPADTPANHDKYFGLPIGHLDLDALRLIFEYIAEDSRPKDGTRVADTWIRLGHVCRLWRSALLSMPELWARDIVAFGTASALDDMLAFAQDVPLNLDCLVKGSRELPIKCIVPLIPRAGVLRCEMKTPEEQHTVLDTINSRQPIALHTLALHATDAGSGSIEYPASSYATCIERLPIRHLEMHELFLNPPLLGNLTSWTMWSDKKWIVDQRLSIAAIVNVLAHNTGLEKLSFKDAISISDSDAVAAPVPLAALRILHIWHDRPNESPPALLDYLRFPNPILEQCLISDMAIDTAAHFSEALVPTFSVWAKSPALESAHFLRVECDAEWSGKVLIQLTEYHWVTRDNSSSPIPFELRFEARPWEATYLQLSSIVMSNLADYRIPERITELLWSAHEGVDDNYWSTVLEPFSNVETLFLGDSHTPTVHDRKVYALIALFKALASTRSTGPLLPRLRRLVTVAWETDGLDLIGVQIVLPTLQRRKEMGVPVREIRFLGMNGPDGDDIDDEDEWLIDSVHEQMEGLAEDLGVGVENRECWGESRGKRYLQWTDFIFHY
ncbi:hypothetical protein PENSPDRAFT_291084 [Peniophora sp. CONT]|nr:hypothetical protein PENSPDRAFT_291084 [Peniophora sp. CONT]